MLNDELVNLNLGDKRLKKRSIKLLEILGSKPQQSIPCACNGWGETKAAMNRTALLIPALCGKLNDRELTQILNQTPHSDLKKWEDENIPYTMHRKRQAFFNQNKSQIAGSVTLE